MDTGKLTGQSSAGAGAMEHADGIAPAQQPASPAGETSPVRLAFASFLMLFVELALIRWAAANNVYVNNATNFVLLASFLGIGIGFLNARAKRDYARWAPVALLAPTGFVLVPGDPEDAGWPHPFRGLDGSSALPRPLSLGIVFLLTVAVMAGLGQAVARIFVQFRPLAAYQLDILGRLAGIAVFSLLSFRDQPPNRWCRARCGRPTTNCRWPTGPAHRRSACRRTTSPARRPAR